MFSPLSIEVIDLTEIMVSGLPFSVSSRGGGCKCCAASASQFPNFGALTAEPPFERSPTAGISAQLVGDSTTDLDWKKASAI